MAVPWNPWDLVMMQDELSALAGRDVEIVDMAGLRNPYRRKEILRTREVVYAA